MGAVAGNGDARFFLIVRILISVFIERMCVCVCVQFHDTGKYKKTSQMIYLSRQAGRNLKDKRALVIYVNRL